MSIWKINFRIFLTVMNKGHMIINQLSVSWVLIWTSVPCNGRYMARLPCELSAKEPHFPVPQFHALVKVQTPPQDLWAHLWTRRHRNPDSSCLWLSPMPRATPIFTRVRGGGGAEPSTAQSLEYDRDRWVSSWLSPSSITHDGFVISGWLVSHMVLFPNRPDTFIRLICTHEF